MCVVQIAVCALRFFLTGEQEDGDDKEDSSSESEVNITYYCNCYSLFQ